MYPDQLEKQEPYCFTQEDVFRNGESFHAFLESDYSIGMHIQKFFEVNIVYQGTGMHYIGENRVPARPGDTFIIPPDVRHGYAGGKGFDVYHLLISNRFMEKSMADLQQLNSFSALFQVEPLLRMNAASPLYLTLKEAQLAEIKGILFSMEKYNCIKDYSEFIISNSMGMILITKLCDIFAQNARQETSGTVRYDKAFMDSLALIHEHYYEKLDITRLAKTAHLSRNTYIRRFWEVCGMPPLQYITRKRIEAARQMLANTALPVSEIAAATGFYDASHFIRSFLAATGDTPAAYRRKCT